MQSALLAIAALVIGLAVGWFLGSRPVAEWRRRFAARDGEARELDEKFRRAITELAGASERASRTEALIGELAGVRGERDALGTELATLKANAANFDEQKRLLLDAQAMLKKEFEAAGAKVLEGAQEAFLKRAHERLVVSEERSEEKIKALLAPVGERLKSYEEQVVALEAKRVDSFGQLTGLIEGMRVGQEQVRAEAARLVSSLRNAPKTRGRWGEQALKNVLEQCGLSEHTDFITEHSINTAEGRLRPDAIVRIPGNKLLVIDAKVSLNDYQDAFDATDDKVRDDCLDRHVTSMRTHIQTLAAKSYQSQFDEAPDYVLMFIPGEHFIAAAIEHEAKRRSLRDDAQITSPDLWNFAFERRVLLASPTNLVAIARTVAQVWRQDKIAKEAVELGKAGTELYERLGTAADHLKRVGSGLGSAVDNYNKFVGSFERSVLSAGRRLRDKGVEIGRREISEISEIDKIARYADCAGEAPALPLAAAANESGVA